MHAYYFREAARSIRQHRTLATTATVVLTAALALSAVFLLLAHNAQVGLGMMGDRREMIVYLRDDLGPAERDMLVGQLRDLYGSATYVTKEEAWNEMRQQIGDPSLLSAVEDNPLPASVRIKLKPALLAPDSMEAAARQVAQFPEVEDVRYGAEWVRRLASITAGLRIGALAVGLIVALAIVFVLYSTIHLGVLARRQQVEVMSRLGASDAFIAWPYVLEAMIESALAAVIALGAAFGLQQAVAARLIAVVFLPLTWSLVFVGASVALAWFASWLALSRVLRGIGP